MGVFATRAPFRPNNIGLSCVKLDRVEQDEKDGPVLWVAGVDLLDGTPIYDIKPYICLFYTSLWDLDRKFLLSSVHGRVSFSRSDRTFS